jgi:hypothetical protein
MIWHPDQSPLLIASWPEPATERLALACRWESRP